MKITLLDGSIKEVTAPLSVQAFAKSLAPSLGKTTVGAILNQELFVSDDYLLDTDCTLELITPKATGFYEMVLSTTGAALSALAFHELYPDKVVAQLFAIPEEKEFAFTFTQSGESLKFEQLTEIQTKIDALLKTNYQIRNEKVTALSELKLNEYQMTLAQIALEVQGFVIVTYLNDFPFIAKYPVSTQTHLVKNLVIEQLTGSYWQNDAKNLMLQRLHGLAATSPAQLEEKRAFLVERRSRDHRLLNKTAEIFTFDNLIGAGLPLWLPNGTILKNVIKQYLLEKEWEYDYVQIETPVIGTLDLYRTSGHLDHYQDDMFMPFKGHVDNQEEFVLKPMSCPHHIAVYKAKNHSYRDLPIRFAEHAVQHRYESSGSLTGLERVRAMELTDSHIFVRPDQIEQEFKAIYQLIEEVLKTFKIEIDYLSFSVRDQKNKEKFFDNEEMWNRAETELEKVLQDLNLKYKKMVGEAAFYGPKLDIQIRTAQNHEITVSTIQLDFLLPEKFDVTYTDQKGSPQRPIMIHRGLIGTYERFIAVLLEQTKGVFPVWLAPVQVEIIPVGNEESSVYASAIAQKLKNSYLRAHIDWRDERLSYKIRDAQIHKIPYQIVLGAKEVKDNLVTYRQYGQDEQISLPVEEFLTKLVQENAERVWN